MRRIISALAVLALAVTVAVAQPPRERAVTFKQPQAIQPGEMPAVARGAAEAIPPVGYSPSTPVARTTNSSSRPPASGNGPAWLTGVDPNVLPAAGIASKLGSVRPLMPTPTSMQPKGQTLTTEKTVQPMEQPTAATPFRGTSVNGAPVFAGPPAYRWYGYGSVTPGANQFAPTGQYPKASANWYSITGATPGAFPVPVMNPLRSPPGTEPPTYVAARPQSQAEPVGAIMVHAEPQPQAQPRPTVQYTEPPVAQPTVESKFSPEIGSSGSSSPAPVHVPKLTAPPTTLPIAVNEPAPITLAVPTNTEPVPSLPTTEPAKPAPGPLPISVTAETKREEQRWLPATEPARPVPGTWTPASAPPQPK